MKAKIKYERRADKETIDRIKIEVDAITLCCSSCRNSASKIMSGCVVIYEVAVA